MKKSGWAEKRSKFGLLFILPGFLGVSVFCIFPFLDVIRRSFVTAIGGSFVGFDNYISVFNSRTFYTASINTLKFTLICIPILLLVSLFFSLLVCSIKKINPYLKSVYYLPLAIPVASAAMLCKIIFSDLGLANAVLMVCSRSTVDWLSGESAFFVVSLIYLWKNVGYDMILWTAGISGISTSVLEAAELDGCTGIRKVIYIILPQLKGTAFTVTILSIINSFKVFREIYLVAGDYPNDSIYMLQNVFSNWFVTLDIQKMSAGAVLLASVITISVLLIQKGFYHEKDIEEDIR